MTRETHSKGGILFALLLLNYLIKDFIKLYNIPYVILLIFIFFYFANIGALFPDIDQRKSSISRRYPFLSKHIGPKCKHRGITHSLLGVLIIIFLWLIIIYISTFNEIIICTAFGFICGYISHIALDLINHDGTELFYPCRINLSLGKIKTGGKGEKVFQKLINLLNYALIGYNLYLIFYNTLPQG